MTHDLSMQDKLAECARIADDLCYTGTTPNDPAAMRAAYGAATTDLLWMYAEGAFHDYHHSRIHGLCSLAQIIAYDIAAEDDKLTAHLSLFRSFAQPEPEPC